jgi:hypothetical protein
MDGPSPLSPFLRYSQLNFQFSLSLLLTRFHPIDGFQFSIRKRAVRAIGSILAVEVLTHLPSVLISSVTVSAGKRCLLSQMTSTAL